MEIIVNGETVSCQGGLISHFREEKYSDADVTIVNGFQTLADRELEEGDILTFIKKGQMPKQEELESMMAARHTPFVHHCVKKGKVAVAGLGGLGSNISIMLARTGVGHLFLVDFDIVEPSNLNRQAYSMKHLGRYKTEALREQLLEINPFIQVDIKTIRVEEDNVVDLFSDFDVVCEAFDNPQAKAMIVSGVLENLPGTKLVSGSGMAGYGDSNLIKTHKRLKNFYICGDLEEEAREGMGLMAPRVGVCASHQANMVLRLLLGEE